MIDRKTIIAFVLIGIVLLAMPIYQKLFFPAKRPTVSKRGSELSESPKNETVTKNNTLSSNSSNFSKKEPLKVKMDSVSREFQAREIILENDLVTATLSTQGGILTSWKLKRFNDATGKKVDLISPGQPVLGIKIIHSDSIQVLDNLEFSPDINRLSVNKGKIGRIRLTCNLNNGRHIERFFELKSDKYELAIGFRFIGFDSDWRYSVGWTGGIPLTERNLADDASRTSAFIGMGGEAEKINCNKGNNRLLKSFGGKLDWVAIRNKYFLVAYLPNGEKNWEGKINGNFFNAEKKSFGFQLESKISEGVWDLNRLYLGPLKLDLLREFGVGLEKVLDLGWRLIRPISEVILWLFLWLHRFIPNYGVVIIVFSLIIKIVVYPLTHKSYTSSVKMQRLQPMIASLREKYKGDAQRLNQETMKLYKEQGVNPFGGCLPMILQMPVFFALYSVFASTIELRRAEFVWWIKDLSEPDPYFVLPILMGISTFLQQKLTMTSKDTNQMIMLYIMPVVLVFFFFRLASGLVLYWTLFNILSLLQQMVMNRYGKMDSIPATKVEAPSKRKRK